MYQVVSIDGPLEVASIQQVPYKADFENSYRLLFFAVVGKQWLPSTGTQANLIARYRGLQVHRKGQTLPNGQVPN